MYFSFIDISNAVVLQILFVIVCTHKHIHFELEAIKCLFTNKSQRLNPPLPSESLSESTDLHTIYSHTCCRVMLSCRLIYFLPRHHSISSPTVTE